jgi:hypothetical protein
MSGYPDFNFPAFHEAARALRGRGYTILNPADKETRDGTDQPDPDKMSHEFGGNSIATAADVHMDDARMILLSDGIVLLPGWEHSRGALHEASLAQMCGKRIFKLQADNSLKLLDRRWRFDTVINWRESVSG